MRRVFTWKAITAAALVGGGLFSYYEAKQRHRVGSLGTGWSRGVFVLAVVGVWFWLAVVRLVWISQVYPRWVSPLRDIPTAEGGHWLFGHGLDIVKSKSGGPFRQWMAEIPNDGMLRFFWFLNLERVLLTSPKSLAEVLVTNNYAFHKPESISTALSPMLGFGILLTEGEQHKRQRRILNPAFAFRHVKDMYPIFWDKACEAARAMAMFAELEVGGWASRATLDILGVAGLGQDFQSIADQHSELVRTYDFVFRPSTASHILNVMATFLPGWFVNGLPIQRNRDVKKMAGRIRGLCRELIRDKKQRIANKEQRGVDILSVALESGGFGDDELVDQLMTFLAAGHETTAQAITWAIYVLCLHPHVQTRLRREIRSHLPSTACLSPGGPPVTSADIDRMPYLAAVCNEVLRVWSPIPTTVREAARDTTIQGHAIPKGTVLILSPWAMNVNPLVWGPTAGVFDPERWLPRVAFGEEGAEPSAEEKARAASGGASSNYAFLTFLHGPRSCIGAGFARAEMACLLAAWVGRFEFGLVDEGLMDEARMELKMEVTAKPARGLHVRMRVVEDDE